MTPLFARQQDPERAFERLYRTHVHDVYRYALMVLRNREDAEDVVQTTFLKAYRVFARGERPRNARPWLITIAHNTCRTRLRDAKRRPQEVAFEERVAESLETNDHDGVEPKELLRALGALSFNQRSALVMRELEGRSYSEIAQALDVSPSAVETLLFRARRAVREQLEGALTCGEAERALSLDLDGRLAREDKSHLRAHLRTCAECASLARRQRARRAALRGLGPVPLPGSLASWGGGAATGTGIAAKVAAVVVAGAAAAGVAFEAVEAVPEAAAQPPPAARLAAAEAQWRFANLVALRSPRAHVPLLASVAGRHVLPFEYVAALEAVQVAWPPSRTGAAGAPDPVVAAGGPLADTVQKVAGATGATTAALPAVTVPPSPVQAPSLPSPTVEAPSLPAPSVEAPTLPAPPVDVPAVEIPKVEAPPVSAPPLPTLPLDPPPTPTLPAPPEPPPLPLPDILP